MGILLAERRENPRKETGISSGRQVNLLRGGVFFCSDHSFEIQNRVKSHVFLQIIRIFVPDVWIGKRKKLRHSLYIILWVCLLLPVTLCAKKRQAVLPTDVQELKADSLMSRVIFFAPMYEEAVSSYKANLYIKGRIDILKQNFLLRFWPDIFRLRKGVREYMMETYGELNYTAPDTYDQRIMATIGTSSDFWEMDHRLPEYFHVNVYSNTLLNDKLISPLAPNAPNYYRYRLDSIGGPPHDRTFKIHFIPRTKSFQLVEGHVIVSDNVWSIREMHFSGRSEWFTFRVQLQMGEVGREDEFLPLACDLEGSFGLLGNKLEGKYTALLDYKEITPRSSEVASPRKKRNRYDLTESYVLRCDTNALVRDTATFNALRPLPLSENERALYRNYYQSLDSVPRRKRKRSKSLEFMGQVGDMLISDYTLRLNKVGSVRCSPLVNPFLLSYSGSNGFSYRQEFKYNRLFPGDRLLRIVPKVGYNFTRKEFYWSLDTDFGYLPEKRASFHINIGNGNRIYNSRILEDLKAIPDSVFDFDQIHLDYFKDFYFRLRHTWEIVNGLTLDIGLSIHRRTEVERSKFQFIYPETPPVKSVGEAQDPAEFPVIPAFDPELLNRFRHSYNSFAPRIALEWTPGQYYYMDGKRKVNLYSHYPTISVDWERGIGGVLPNSGSYERIEVDYQHKIALRPMHTLYYRMGWGKFTKQGDIYFVDFANLSRHNLPVGWNDEIGGVFQLLDGRWYNASREYVRGHIMYEAPFLILPHLMKYTQYVLNERIYLNALAMPHLKPYLEAGYGIGTHVFDFGVFVSFANWKYQEIGCKFTFELFNR